LSLYAVNPSPQNRQSVPTKPSIRPHKTVNPSPFEGWNPRRSRLPAGLKGEKEKVKRGCRPRNRHLTCRSGALPVAVRPTGTESLPGGPARAASLLHGAGLRPCALRLRVIRKRGASRLVERSGVKGLVRPAAPKGRSLGPLTPCSDPNPLPGVWGVLFPPHPCCPARDPRRAAGGASADYCPRASRGRLRAWPCLTT